MTRPIGLLAALLAAVLLASACSKDDPKPNFSSVATTPTTSSPSPTESPSPTGVPSTGPNSSPGESAPMTPALATVDSAEGAQSFASWYFRMLDWSYAVNRSDLMDRFFSSTCTNCSKLTSNLKATFDRGTVTGTRISIKQIALVTNDKRAGAEYAVDGVLDISAGQLAESGSTAPIPAQPNVIITLWVKFMNDGWFVVSQAQA